MPRAGLFVFVEWAPQEGAVGYHQNDTTLTSSNQFRYPSPVLTPGSLYLDQNAPVLANSSEGNLFAVVNLAANNSPRKLSFTGLHFGSDPGQAQVTYANADNSFICSLVEEESTFSDSTITCETATGEPFSDYVFTVTVGEHNVTGVDVLRFLPQPSLTSVSGCDDSTRIPNGTADCPTAGGTTLTLVGDGFASATVCVLI